MKNREALTGIDEWQKTKKAESMTRLLSILSTIYSSKR